MNFLVPSHFTSRPEIALCRYAAEMLSVSSRWRRGRAGMSGQRTSRPKTRLNVPNRGGVSVI